MKNSGKLRVLRVAAAIVTVVSVYIFAPWEFALYYLSPLPSTVQEQVDEATRQGLDGIIVYVQKRDEEPELYASGWHNRQKKIPADPRALFKIGSIRKLYDAAAVAKLAARGTVTLNDTLAEHLPMLASRIKHADKITLRMMVQHQSGIPNYTDHDTFSWSEPITPDNALALALDMPAEFEPGTDYSYSNTNYLLLRRIMSNALGYDHGRFIKDEILAPLDLKETFLSVREVDLNRLMSGYYVGYDADFKELDQGFVATAEDVGIFLRALNEGTFFNDPEREIYASLYEFGHTGWVLGYSSIARYHQDIDTVVVQFINTNGNDTVMLAEIVYGRILKLLK